MKAQDVLGHVRPRLLDRPFRRQLLALVVLDRVRLSPPPLAQSPAPRPCADAFCRCNEVGFFQEGAPLGRPTIVTRLVQPAYDERQCKYMFPEAFEHLGEQLPVPDVAATNKAYHGWFVQEKHLFFANGIRAFLSLSSCLLSI